MALKVGELYASFGIDSKTLDSAMSSIESKMSSVGSSMTKSGLVMSAAITAPLMKAGKAVYEAGTEFYSQMSRVEAISGASGEQLDALTAAAIEMGSTTSFTASEAGKALEYMAMAGWDSEQMLDGLAPIINLAAASGEELATVSDIVTDALTAFGLEASDAAHFSDVLAAVATSANTNVGMMGETFQYVAPLAGAMGYDIEDMALAIGLMANAGIKSTTAGTQLRQMLTNLAKPTDAMQKAMDDLNISLTDSGGNMLGFDDIIGDLRTAFAGLTEEEQLYYAATIAGTRGASGLLAIVNATDEDVAKLTGEIEDCTGAADEMAETMLDNAKGDVTIFKSALEGLEITLWSLAEGGFRQIVQKATSMIDSFRNADESTQKLVLKVGGLAAALGPALMVGGRFITFLGKLPGLLLALTTPMGLLAAGIGIFALAAVDTKNEVGKAFETMASKVRVKLMTTTSTIATNMKFISKRMPQTLKSLSKGFSDIIPAGINLAFTSVTGFFNVIGDNAQEMADFGIGIIENFVEGLTKGLPKFIPAAVRVVAKLVSALIRNIPKLVTMGAELAKSIWEGLKSVEWVELGKELIESIGTSFSDIVDIVKGWFEKAKEKAQTINWSTVCENIKSKFTIAGDWFKTLILGDAAEDATWLDVGTEIWNSIKSGFESAGDLVKMIVLGDEYTPDSTWSDAGAEIWGAIQAGFDATGDWIKELVLKDEYTPDATWGDVGEAIWESVKAGISAAGDWIKALVLKEEYTPDSTWGEVGSKIWAAITDKFTATGDWIKQIVLKDEYTPDSTWNEVGSKIWTAIQSGFTATGDWIKQLILKEDYTPDATWKDVGSAIWDAIQAGFSSFGDWVKPLVLKDDYSPDSDWMDVGSAIWSSIKAGFSAAGDWIKELVLAEDYTPDSTWGDVGSELWEAIQSGFTATGDWIKKVILKEDYTPESTWSETGSVLWQSIKDGFKATGDWIKELVLKDEYTADSTWGEAGAKIWDGITSGFSTADDWIKQTVLKDEYTPDSTWGDAGSAIWAAIKEGISATGDWVKELVLTDEYTPDSTWGDVGSKIWSGIVSGISTTGDWIKQIVLKDEYTPDSTWAEAGSAIWAAILSGISTTGDWIKQVTLKDDYTPDSTWHDAGVAIWDAIKSGFTATGDWIKGLVLGDEYTPDATWGEVGEEIIRRISDSLSSLTEEDISTAIGDLGYLLETIANYIVTGHASLVEFAGNFFSAIATALSEFTGWEQLGNTMSNVAASIIGAIANSIPALTNMAVSLLDAIGKLLSDADGKGAFASMSRIAQAILDGIAATIPSLGTAAVAVLGALGDLLASVDWGNVASVATELATTLLNALKDLPWSEIFTTAASIVVSIGKVIAENASEIATAALDLALQLLEGLAGVDWATVSRDLSTALGNLITSISNWFSDPDNSKRLLEIGGIIAGGIFEGLWTDFKDDLKKGLGIDLDALFSEDAIADAGVGRELTVPVTVSAKTEVTVDEAAAQDETESAVNAALGTDEGHKFTTSLPFDINPTEVTMDNTPFQTIAQESIDTVSNTITEGESTVNEAAQGVVDTMLVPYEDLSPEAKAEAAAMLVAVNAAIMEGTPDATKAIETATRAVLGRAKQILNGKNGSDIGRTFISGIQSAIKAAVASAVTATQNAADSIKNAAKAILNYSAGYSIGINFDYGIAAGIRSGTGAIASAARQAAYAALGAAKSALDIESPSKAGEKEIGWMWDAGIVKGILGRMSTIEKASDEVYDALSGEFYVGDPSQGTIYTSRQTARETAVQTARETADTDTTEKARAMGRAMADRLIESGALDADITMDGDKVGEKTTKPVSRNIQRKSRRTISGRSAQGVLVTS